MMPIWLHVVVVLCLLTSNGITLAVGLYHFRRLKRALDTRDELLGKGDGRPETYGDLLPKLLERLFS